MNVRRLALAQAEAGERAFDFDRVAQGGLIYNRHVFAGHYPKFEKSLHKRRGAGDGLDSTRATGDNLVKGGHQACPVDAGIGRTRICDESQPRRQSLQPATCRRHGVPLWSI